MSELPLFYKEWPLLDALPEGWFFAQAGSPLTGYKFAMSASPLRNGKTALVQVTATAAHQEPTKDVLQQADRRNQSVKNNSRNDFFYKPEHAKTVNDLARQKFKQKMLNDILVDLMVCEIEGWDKHEYINELRGLINEIGTRAEARGKQ